MKKHKNKDWLYGKYWIEKLSMPKMAKLCNIDYSTLRYWMIKFGIKRRTMSETAKGAKHYNWKGGTVINSNGYAVTWMPDHPCSNCRGYVKRSRLVMEKYLGRYLDVAEIVHHKNEIRDDDKIENLRLFETKGKHNSFHRKLRKLKSLSLMVAKA